MLEFLVLFAVSMVEMRFPGLSLWKSRPVELIQWLISESQAQLSLSCHLVWEAAGVTEAAFGVYP